jgi:hypothetical protein
VLDLSGKNPEITAGIGGQFPVIYLMFWVLNSGGQNVLNSGEKTPKKAVKITDYGDMAFLF